MLDQVREMIAGHDLLASASTVVIGLSGGPDSLALLDALWRLAPECDWSLHVAHFHHQIRGAEADADAAFAGEMAAERELPFHMTQQDVPALAAETGLSLEEAARQARYAFLAHVASEVDAEAVAVGHNADDQTETVLMHWLRGAGPAGLRGMLPATDLSEMLTLGQRAPALLRLIRPLIETTRVEIEAYCQAQGLQPRFDRSNLDTTYYRNRLRHELIPYLETFNPNIRETIRRSARIMADEYAFLRQAMDDAWERVVGESTAQTVRMDLIAWRGLPINLQRSILRKAVHRLRRSLRNINWVHIEQAREIALNGDTGQEATLPQGLLLRLGYDDLTIADQEALTVSISDADWPLLSVPRLELAVPAVTPLPAVPWQAETALLPRQELPKDYRRNPDRWRAYLDADQIGQGLCLRWRMEGETFCPLGLGGHRKSLSEWMIDAKIPAIFRDRLAVLASSNGVLWIPGGQLDERAKITARTRRILAVRLCRNVRLANTR